MLHSFAGHLLAVHVHVHFVFALRRSVFELNPRVQMWMREALAEIGADCEVALAKDGSGMGAAVIAATVGRSKL